MFPKVQNGEGRKVILAAILIVGALLLQIHVGEIPGWAISAVSSVVLYYFGVSTKIEDDEG